ncbi:uncharacterized protein LOC132612781 [Lycium barbarum]|uniref:uncharacterized protein LOC132612781 n=1 Tax=Lycium barbarum TaxID=112863 RepID=UPI00293F49E9|nr:uncharacterized protein LOC132612781 [Lycium barbarum]
MWLQLHGRLLTVDRLNKWGIRMDPKCVMCKQVDETRDHLFGDCCFAATVWDRLLNWLKMGPQTRLNWSEHYHWILDHTKGKTVQAKILKMVYAEFIHYIWLERNARVFEKMEKTEDIIARNIACCCNIRALPASRIYLDNCMF